MVRWSVLALVAACSYNPRASSTPGDGPGSDGSLPDDSNVTVDARACFGTSIVIVCLDVQPTGEVTLPAATNPLDTSVDANCTEIEPQTNGPDLCVIAGTTVTVSASFVAIGSRPLVLVGIDAVNVTGSGTIDVSSTSTRTGAGHNEAACEVPNSGTSDGGGAGGGAGGSFGTGGGNGGTGDTNGGAGGMAPGGVVRAAQPIPAFLRGGCPGGQGGAGNGTNGGPPGDGGGAAHLIAGASIMIEGNVFASGVGGKTHSGNTGFREGGGGGGSGGMIGIDAPAISIAGIVAANGGAGAGGGGDVAGGGTPGGDGTTIMFSTRAVHGAGDTGGGGAVGSDGTALGGTTASTAASGTAGGGGGGAGVGVIWIDGTVNGGLKISPPPTPH